MIAAAKIDRRISSERLAAAAAAVRTAGDAEIADAIDRAAGDCFDLEYLFQSARSRELHKRDELLQQCASLPHFKGLSIDARAHEIEAGWARYFAIPGRRERGLAECPRHRIGRPEEFYFMLTKLGFSPLKARRLQTILPQ
jgi:hypothetical protein